MKRELRDKWVAALESGNFPKTTGQLYRNEGRGEDGYCCLGVLAVVAGLPLSDGKDCGRNDPPSTRDAVYGGTGLIIASEAQELYRINDRSDTFDPVIKRIKVLIPVED